MKKLREVCADLAERLDLPEETLNGAVRLTAVGDRRALIENHQGLLEYGDAQIRVSTGRGQLVLRGSGLGMDAMNRGELLIRGTLQSVEWE
ncbi:MAG: YabP/YqfC family sporulation protein [Oscillospiraceae bacterium]|nr:YabP/YqfC family sporulation protein [Oscillospiraceae bacterium]